jgi:hypothetical protein
MEMPARARLILALVMSAVMVMMVTLLVTFLDLGLRSDFLRHWVRSYFIAWPVAATTPFLNGTRAAPHGAPRLADRPGRVGLSLWFLMLYCT